MADRAGCRLDVSSVDHPACRHLLEVYERAGMAVRLWDVTSDLGVAAFLCDINPAVYDPTVDLPRFRGAGCHPSRGVALARALTEAAQVRLTYIAGIRDDLPREYKRSHLQKLGLELHDRLSDGAALRSFRQVPTFESDDLRIEVRWLLEQLRGSGVEEVIMLDLTRPDFHIPVCKVIVPGLEGNSSHPHYSPGPRARAAHGASV